MPCNKCLFLVLLIVSLSSWTSGSAGGCTGIRRNAATDSTDCTVEPAIGFRQVGHFSPLHKWAEITVLLPPFLAMKLFAQSSQTFNGRKQERMSRRRRRRSVELPMPALGHVVLPHTSKIRSCKDLCETQLSRCEIQIGLCAAIVVLTCVVPQRSSIYGINQKVWGNTTCLY